MILKQTYNHLYSFLQSSLDKNPFIPKYIDGKKVLNGHIRTEQETNPKLDDLIEEQLSNYNIPHSGFTIDIPSFKDYLSQTAYELYYGENYIEKGLEHFVSLELLDLNEESVLIDVGAGNSPFRKIVSEKYSARNSYALDKHYKHSHETSIAGLASSMPFLDNSVDALTLHCSLEHFEGNEDVEFFKEAERVLKKGGKCIILPFYLSSAYTIHLDPVNNLLKWHRPSIRYDNEAVIRYCDSRQAFSRHYDVETFRKRILQKINKLSAEVLRVSNFKHVNEDCYLRFICVLTKNKP